MDRFGDRYLPGRVGPVVVQMVFKKASRGGISQVLAGHGESQCFADKYHGTLFSEGLVSWGFGDFR
jgi:hypothetical protein